MSAFRHRVRRVRLQADLPEIGRSLAADSGLPDATSAGVPGDLRQTLGKLGENLACDELCRRGYVILARRHRTRYGEIDVIARHGAMLVFVEVKARRHDGFGGAGAAVTSWKQRRIAQMAADYLARHDLSDAPCRFDVVAIDFMGGRPRIEVYMHAFTADV